MAACGETIVARSAEREKESAHEKLKIATVPVKFSLFKWRDCYSRGTCKNRRVFTGNVMIYDAFEIWQN